MNTEEVTKELQDIVDGCETAGDIYEKVDHLDADKKYQLVYSLLNKEYFDTTKEWSLGFIDWIDRNQIINNYNEQRSQLEPALGMMRMLSTCLQQAYEFQARQEMQSQDESSQWGMRLAEDLSDRSNELAQLVDELSLVAGHYDSVLKGRRMGVEFVDEDGNHTKRERLGFAKKSIQED